MMTAVYLIMGVSGCGKTTVGRALAARLGCPFYDGDDFHPAENVAKMAAGIPLTDADRWPWLERLAALIAGQLAAGQMAVLACSALKKGYRQRLQAAGQVQFIYLYGDFDLIWQRLQGRRGHYMKAEMLHSQFAALEPPDAQEALAISITASLDEILNQIQAAIATP